MSDNYVEHVAGELADLALADAAASNDDTIVDVISEMIGASSQTLQEAFMTAVRVRRAEARARAHLAGRAAQHTAAAKSLLADADKPSEASTTHETGTTAPTAQDAETPQSKEDAAFADVLNSLDNFMKSDDTDDTPSPGITPGRPTR